MNPEARDTTFLLRVLNSIPALIFVVGTDARVHFVNSRAAEHLGLPPQSDEIRRGGDLFRCVHAYDNPDGCGAAEHCRTTCAVRRAVIECLEKGLTARRFRVVMEIGNPECPQFFHARVTTTPIAFNDEGCVLLTVEDITDLVRLGSLLPICSSCKKIRNDENYWESVEQFFTERSDVAFSHGLCPTCLEKVLAEIHDQVCETGFIPPIKSHDTVPS